MSDNQIILDLEVNAKPEGNIENVDFASAISDRYFAYALSTIMSRSLPSVCDGLKPVHRRLIYAMYKLKLDPKSNFKKSARVVGDVIGKYHPHGEIAVYDTLVRLVQSFSLRYPLVEGQGNFGSIDGDNAAAMRYTEARMTNICTLLIEDIESDTVDFIPTYDSSDTEPILMPAKFPNLLANGSEGIAVGMATSIPPHNLKELADALIYLLDHESKDQDVQDHKKIMKFIKGPDFPTGGIIIENQEYLADIYRIGKGTIRVRARWEVEQLKNGLYQIVITEIPYQVQKIKLLEQIIALFKDKKLPLISNIADESTENIRIVIEPKSKNVQADTIMESLFKLTALQSRIKVNMNVLDNKNVPRVLSITQILQQFLEYRKNIVTRRTQYQIVQIEQRLEVLDALKVVYLNLDRIIEIIRNEDHPKPILIDEFNINHNQAEAILNIKLRLLRKLEEEKIITEYKELQEKLNGLKHILTDNNALAHVIKTELQHIKKEYGSGNVIGKRKTDIMEYKIDENITLDISAFVEKEPITIICSKLGWIKSMKGHKLNLENVRYKENDCAEYILELSSTDQIIIASSSGKFFTLLAANIATGKTYGSSLKIITDIENDNIVNIFTYKQDTDIILAASNGKGFIISSNDLISSKKNGKQIMQLDDDKNEKLMVAHIIVNGDDHMAIFGSNRNMLVFPLTQIPTMKKGKGVIMQKYNNSQARLSDVTSFKLEQGLSWNISNGKIRRVQDLSPWIAKRATLGKKNPNAIPKNNKLHNRF